MACEESRSSLHSVISKPIWRSSVVAVLLLVSTNKLLWGIRSLNLRFLSTGAEIPFTVPVWRGPRRVGNSKLFTLRKKLGLTWEIMLHQMHKCWAWQWCWHFSWKKKRKWSLCKCTSTIRKQQATPSFIVYVLCSQPYIALNCLFTNSANQLLLLLDGEPSFQRWDVIVTIPLWVDNINYSRRMTVIRNNLLFQELCYG